MVTGNFHAVFDAQIYREFVQIVGKGNVTRKFMEYMQNTIASSNKDTAGLNVQILNIEIERLQNKLGKVQSELNIKQQLKENHGKLMQEREKGRLEAEKKRIEAAKTCANCGIIIDLKSHKFKKGNICNGCFLTATGKQIAEWNKL